MLTLLVVYGAAKSDASTQEQMSLQAEVKTEYDDEPWLVYLCLWVVMLAQGPGSEHVLVSVVVFQGLKQVGV